MYPNQGEGATQAPVSAAVPQKLLEEMLWFFRVEDGKWQRAGVWGVCSQHKTHTADAG